MTGKKGYSYARTTLVNPKTKLLNNLVILSDLRSGKVYLDAMHKDGMNVLYGNGAAKFVPATYFKQYLSLQQYMVEWNFGTDEPNMWEMYKVWDAF